MSVSFDFENDDEAQEILGIRDIQLRMIRDGFGVQAVARGRRLDLDGDADRIVFHYWSEGSGGQPVWRLLDGDKICALVVGLVSSSK